MKTPYMDRQTALKALLVMVIGANFLANLRLAEFSARPGSANLLSAEGDVAAAGEGGGTAAAAATLTITPRGGDAGRGGDSGAGRGRSLTENTALRTPEQRVQVQWLEQRPAAIELLACRDPERKYVISFHPARVDGEIRTTVEVREAARASERGTVFSLSLQPGNANDPSTREELFARAQRQIRSHAGECAQRGDSQDPATITCEGENLTPVAASDCNLRRLRGLPQRRPRLEGAEMMSAIEALTESLKSALRAMAAGDCDGETGRGERACRSGNAESLRRQVESALRSLMNLPRDVNKERIRRLIASLRGVVAAEVAAKEGRRLREQGERLTERIRETQQSLREIARQCRQDAAESLRDGVYPDISDCRESVADQLEELRQLRADRFDLFRDAYQGGERGQFQRLVDLRDQMDRTEWNDLRSYARPDFIGALTALRRADANPIDFLTGRPDRLTVSVNQQMDQALRRLGVSSGAAQGGFQSLADSGIDARGGFIPRSGVVPIAPGIVPGRAAVVPYAGAGGVATVPVAGSASFATVPSLNQSMFGAAPLGAVPVTGAQGGFTPVNGFSGAAFAPGVARSPLL